MDFNRRLLTVEGRNAKNRQTRHVPLNDEAVSVLRNWRERARAYTRAPSPMRKFGRELLQTLLIMGVLFLGTRTVVQNFRVDGPSMQPTLHSGEFLWVNKAAYFRMNGEYPRVEKSAVAATGSCL